MKYLRYLSLVAVFISTHLYANEDAGLVPDDYFACGFKEWSIHGKRLIPLEDDNGRKKTPVPAASLNESVFLSGTWPSLLGEEMFILTELSSEGVISIDVHYSGKDKVITHWSPLFF